jgi:hypothetical protein
MDLRFANNSQGSAQLTSHIKPYFLSLKSRIFNGKIVNLIDETWIWLTATIASNAHGGKLVPQFEHQFDLQTAPTDHQTDQFALPIIANMPPIDHQALSLHAHTHHQ